MQMDVIHPHVAACQLRTLDVPSDVTDGFAVHSVHNPLPGVRKAFAVSFFCKDSDSRHPGEHPDPDRAPGSKWHAKYLVNLRNLVLQVKSDFPDWKLRVYLANDLQEFYLSELQRHSHVEVYVMVSSSVGANPGAMWRYGALGDAGLDLVFAVDVDDGLGHRHRVMLAEFERHPDKALIRELQRPVTIWPNKSDAINLPAIIGSAARTACAPGARRDGPHGTLHCASHADGCLRSALGQRARGEAVRLQHADRKSHHGVGQPLEHVRL